MHFVTYYACCLFAANILHRPLDDKDQDGTDDRHHGEGEVDLVVTTSEVTGRIGLDHDTREILRYCKTADTPGGKDDAVVGADILGTVVVSGKGGHHGQVSAVREADDTQADEHQPEVLGVPEEEQAGYNIHTELCCPRCQRPYRSCCSFSLSMILAKANRLAVKPCLTV